MQLRTIENIANAYDCQADTLGEDAIEAGLSLINDFDAAVYELGASIVRERLPEHAGKLRE